MKLFIMKIKYEHMNKNFILIRFYDIPSLGYRFYVHLNTNFLTVGFCVFLFIIFLMKIIK